MFKLFANGQVLQPDFSLKRLSILVQDEIIYDIFDADHHPDKPVDSEVDLEGQIIFPGLINAHDHLIDTSWVGLGDVPVENWYDWDRSMRESCEYKMLQRLSVTDLYVVGMYKNIISGVTTVVDHFPPEVSNTFTAHDLTTLLDHFYLAHSVSNHQLQWGRNTAEQCNQSRGILPFIIHIGEGSSKELREELEALNRMGALGKNTILVNGAYLQDAELQIVANRGASLVWLPNSAKRIFGRQPDIQRIIELGIPITIGTDSSNSGSTNLLSEFKTAMDYSREHLSGKLTAKNLVELSTIGAAKIFGIDKLVGSLNPGKRADFIVFENRERVDPFENFINLRPEQFSMVIHKGIMIVGNDEFRRISSIDFSQYSEVKINGVTKLLLGRPIQLLERIRHKVGKEVVFPFFNVTSEE